MDEIETSKSNWDQSIENGRFDKSFKQDERFHKERLELEKEYNEKRSKLQKELDEKSEKRHGKALLLTRILVIVTAIMAIASFWNAYETRKLVEMEYLADFDFKVTSQSEPFEYVGIQEVSINEEKFHDLPFTVEIFNSGKAPLKILNIPIQSECFKLESLAIFSTRYDEDTVYSGKEVKYDDIIASRFFEEDIDLPCEIIFTANTNKLSKSAKIILK